MEKYVTKLKNLMLINKITSLFINKKESNVDKYKVIRIGNVVVAQGYECSKCKTIRPHNQPICNCH